MRHEIESIRFVAQQGSPGMEVSTPQQPVRREPAAGSGPDQPAVSPPSTLDVAPPDLRRVLEGLGRHLNVGVTYQVDRETNDVIIKVIDRETKEVLRQIPPEEMMRLRAAFRHVFGILFQAEA
jgi:flagellar protein FlaG